MKTMAVDLAAMQAQSLDWVRAMQESRWERCTCLGNPDYSLRSFCHFQDRGSSLWCASVVLGQSVGPLVLSMVSWFDVGTQGHECH